MEIANQNQANDVWQAEVLGQIYDTNFVEMAEWINIGSLQPSDKVRRGNLRWIDAGKVPLLIPFFNAKERGIEPPPIRASFTNAAESPSENFTSTQNFVPDQSPPKEKFSQSDSPVTQNRPVHNTSSANVCVLHPEFEAKFSCETCANNFCGQCPKSYGGTVKICPMCGAMCKKIGEADRKKEKEFRYGKSASGGLDFSDVMSSFAHPFKFTTSFLIGGAMFMVFSVGQTASASGGLFMISVALICFLLANTVSFGVLSNTIENFSKGDMDADFMPQFEDFNVWNNVVHPFFLSIAVYLTSFGPTIAVAVLTVFVAVGFAGDQFKNKQSPNTPNQTAPKTGSSPVGEKRVVDQTEEVKKIVEGAKQSANERRRLSEQGLTDQSDVSQTSSRETEKSQPESVADISDETRSRQMEQKMTAFAKRGIFLIIALILAVLWGIFYFPAACAVAGYTRSFFATLNPSVGFSTIKTLGVDYIKILIVFILLLIAAVVVGGFFTIMLYAFSLVGMGNIPAIVATSWFTFYTTIVFSCVLGYALFRNSDKFKFYRG